MSTVNGCTLPDTITDGVTLPLADPCRGQLPLVQAGGSSKLRLNDNIPGEPTDDDFNDAMWDFIYTSLGGTVEASYTYTGSLSAHDVGASIDGVFLLRTPGTHTLGAFAPNTQLPVYMHDFTQGQIYTATNPQVGWTLNQGPVVPEPSTAVLLAVGISLLLIAKRLRRLFA